MYERSPTEDTSITDVAQSSVGGGSRAAGGSVPFGPGRLRSLWEMLQFYADKFVGISGWLAQMQLSYLNPAPVGSTLSAPSPLADENLVRLIERVGRAKEMASEIRLDGTVRIFDRLVVAIGDPTDQRRHTIANYADGIAHLLGEAAIRIKEELGQRCFVMALPDRYGLYQGGESAFGASVIGAFPSAATDIKAAAECCAIGQSIACIFHCMRVLEYGLRALSADVGLTFDIQQWHNIIDQIESKIRDESRTLPRGAPKNERLQFLSEAAKEFFYFKEGWRNHVSHGRGAYDDQQSLDILNHTRAFMAHLSTRLSE
jgi:hypothetical protein